MDAENGFLIAGKVYEVPMLDSLTLDEAELMYDQSGLGQEDFVQEADESDDEHTARVAKLMRRPGFMASLARIAYQRGNPTVKAAQVQLVIGKTNRLELFSKLASAEPEEDAVPLALTNAPNEPSPNGSPESEPSTGSSPASTGSDSGSGSDGQAGEVVSIGTTRSDTSSTSAPTVSAASASAT